MKKPFKAASRMIDGFKYLKSTPIQSRRLSIAPLTMKDYAGYREFMERDGRDFIKFNQWDKVLDGPQSDDYMRSQIRINRDTFGLQADLFIRRSGSPEIIGSIFVYPGRNSEAIIGYFISRDYRRQGYAREALDAVVDVLRSREPGRDIMAQVRANNKGSARLLRAAGFTQSGQRLSLNSFYDTAERLVTFRI